MYKKYVCIHICIRCRPLICPTLNEYTHLIEFAAQVGEHVLIVRALLESLVYLLQYLYQQPKQEHTMRISAVASSSTNAE